VKGIRSSCKKTGRTGGLRRFSTAIRNIAKKERKKALASLIGIEDTVWVQIDSLSTVFAIANEDPDRTAPGKTSAARFMLFELTP